MVIILCLYILAMWLVLEIPSGAAGLVIWDDSAAHRRIYPRDISRAVVGCVSQRTGPARFGKLCLLTPDLFCLLAIHLRRFARFRFVL
jgi:hypothetical protein